MIPHIFGIVLEKYASKGKKNDFPKYERCTGCNCIADEDHDGHYDYAAFSQNTGTQGGIRIIYESECSDDEPSYEAEKQHNKDIMERFIESIRLTPST